MNEKIEFTCNEIFSRKGYETRSLFSRQGLNAKGYFPVLQSRVFGGSVEEGTRDAVQFFGDVFPGFGGFDEFLFHGLKVLV